MARSPSQTLTLSRLLPLLHPSSRLFNHRRCSYSTDPPPPAADPETPSETEFPAGLRLLENVIYTLTAKVLSSKMVLHKGLGTAPHLRQSRIAASEVLATFGVDPSQNVLLQAAREDLRPGSSTTEDDVHKSVKYNVWSSTPYGNKKLDNAFVDAQRISAGRQRSCHVFLFYSVNASGRFRGVAEMTGQVDFCKNMDFWNQDKWVGSFPVKWHIIKDVPNTSLWHILLENNEFTPVTSSRDTQE